MAEYIAGIVKTCSLVVPIREFGPKGVLLRPVSDWTGELIVGSSVKLVFPNGETYRTRLRGGELWITLPENVPREILLEYLPEVGNVVPAGALVVIEQDIK